MSTAQRTLAGGTMHAQLCRWGGETNASQLQMAYHFMRRLLCSSPARSSTAVTELSCSQHACDE